VIFRVCILLLVAWLGSVVYYSRKEPRPVPLLKLAVVRSLALCAWTVVAFGVMTAIEWIWIDG